MSDDSKSVKWEDPPDDQTKVVENMKDETETHETNKNRTGGKAKRKSSGRAKKTSVEEDSSIGAESSQTPKCGFRERGSIIEQLEKEAQRTLMPSLKIETCCAPILLSFLRSLTDDQWGVIQHGMKNNLTFEQLSMLCLKIVKVVTQTALRILLPALARIMGVNLRSGATSPESQCSLTGSEDSLGSLDEREKRLLISEMNYWTKQRRRNGSAECLQKSTRRTSSPCWSPKIEDTKKDCHSVQEQTEIPSTDGHCIAPHIEAHGAEFPVGDVSPSISQPIKKRSLIVRVFSAMMMPFRRFNKKNL